MSGKPWWSLRGRERAEAKAAYEAAHPLPSNSDRRGGRYVSRSGHAHYYGGRASREVAKIAALADCEPIPGTLTPIEHDGGLFWLGQHGMYRIDLASPTRFRELLRQAIEADNPSRVFLPDAPKVNEQAGNGEEHHVQ